MKRTASEDGIVAVVVAVSCAFLLVLGAMVVDLGQAYVNKRDAQNAADAGALAAASVFKEEGGLCATLVGNSTLQTKAKTAAEAIVQKNLPGGTPVFPHSPKIAVCDGDTLEVELGVSYDSPVGLGQVVPGQGDTINVDRSATAALSRAQAAVGSLRPWMVCGAQIPTGTFPSNVTPVGLPGNGHIPSDPDCVNPNKPGDWWRTTCFNGGGSHGETYNNIINGCEEVTIVPGQTATHTPAERSTYLRSKCGPESTYCLADDTGRDVKTMDKAWDTLLGKTFAMPIFCSDKDCSPTSVTKGGNWPVWKIAAVTLCGYAMKGKRSATALPAGDCTTRNAGSWTPMSAFGDKDDIGFLLVFQGIIDVNAPTTTIDTGTASVRLVE
ncbi:pilus assembly protein TadG-related protein [uncultured Nocardioides sp.]|uniref:pilus assembly protein TadG-related protein n=1 Tax=uncultured Nocardioides sp. TaxID=198441 RepID=UPI002609ACDB|nr:pilus assembly protein TadG-related protein [uncultured Nocardioides sp.]